MSEQKATSKLPSWIQDHIRLYQTDPDKAHYWDSSLGGSTGLLTTLLLTTKGRKSGRDIPTPLIYGPYGSAFVVIASKGGAPDHPDWYKNLVAEPNCRVQAGREVYRARARVATGEERSKLWAQLQKIYPPYDDYQRAAKDRLIPVVVLEPQGPATSA